MSVQERKCGRCGEVESKHTGVEALIKKGHFFERRNLCVDGDCERIEPHLWFQCNFKREENVEIPSPENRKMLIVQLQDRKVGIQFRHRRVKTLLSGTEKVVNVTHCGIYEDTPKGEKPIQICFGTAKCSPLDNFSKEQGRKIALTRALLEGVHEFALSKDKREIVWKAYFNRCNTPEIVPPTAVSEVIDAEVVPEQKLIGDGLIVASTQIH